MNKVEENIKKLIEGTIDGKIKWIKKNPTTYNWMTKASDGTNINTIVQKFNSSNSEEILFRLWNLDEKYSYLDLKNLDCPPILKNLIKELYDTAAGSFSTDDIFSDILRDI